MTVKVLDCKKVGDLLIYHFLIDLSTIALDELKRDIFGKVQEYKVYQVLINLSDVDFLSSKDLSVFIQILRSLEGRRQKSRWHKQILARAVGPDSFRSQCFPIDQARTNH